MDANLNVRIEKAVRDDFTRVCKDQGMTPSEVIRTMMAHYIKKYDGMPGPLDGFDPTDGGRDPVHRKLKANNLV